MRLSELCLETPQNDDQRSIATYNIAELLDVTLGDLIQSCRS